MSDSGELLQFPCRFPIKAMGAAGGTGGDLDFSALVLEIIARHAPGVDEGAVTVRESRGGRWLSVTVVVEAESRDQLDAIYRDLTGHELVVMAL